MVTLYKQYIALEIINYVPIKTAQMKTNESYLINVTSMDEETLKSNPWLLNVLQNKLKSIFMTPSIILNPHQEKDHQTNRILEIFESEGHTVTQIMVIPNQIIEIIVDSQVLIHILFLVDPHKYDSNKISNKVEVLLQNIEISKRANSDAESAPI